MNNLGMRLSVLVTGLTLVLAVIGREAFGGRDVAAGSTQPVLVELFTSEGCSSCPPADRLLAELDRRQDVQGAFVVVLSEHVDYWNHLGWRDPYSSQQWSQRQKAYSRAFHLDGVYTPQAVVDGIHEVVGSNAGDLHRAILESAGYQKTNLQIASASWMGSTLETQITGAEGGSAVLYAAIADDMDRSSVGGGENSGRRLEHVAVARVLVPLTQLHGAAVNEKFHVAFPAGLSKEHTRLIVFTQDKKSGRVSGIASRKL